MDTTILTRVPECQQLLDLLYQTGGWACSDCFEGYATEKLGAQKRKRIYDAMFMLKGQGIIRHFMPGRAWGSHIATDDIPDKNEVYVSSGITKSELAQDFLDFRRKSRNQFISLCYRHDQLRLNQEVR